MKFKHSLIPLAVIAGVTMGSAVPAFAAEQHGHAMMAVQASGSMKSHESVSGATRDAQNAAEKAKQQQQASKEISTAASRMTSQVQARVQKYGNTSEGQALVAYVQAQVQKANDLAAQGKNKDAKKLLEKTNELAHEAPLDLSQQIAKTQALIAQMQAKLSSTAQNSKGKSQNHGQQALKELQKHLAMLQAKQAKFDQMIGYSGGSTAPTPSDPTAPTSPAAPTDPSTPASPTSPDPTTPSSTDGSTTSVSTDTGSTVQSGNTSIAPTN